MIDDHVGCQLHESKGSRQWQLEGEGRDKTYVDAAGVFYKTHGRLRHPKHMHRREVVHTGWGTQNEGITGWAAPPELSFLG